MSCFELFEYLFDPPKMSLHGPDMCSVMYALLALDPDEVDAVPHTGLHSLESLCDSQLLL